MTWKQKAEWLRRNGYNLIITSFGVVDTKGPRWRCEITEKDIDVYGKTIKSVIKAAFKDAYNKHEFINR
jgi:hypothetical protein